MNIIERYNNLPDYKKISTILSIIYFIFIILDALNIIDVDLQLLFYVILALGEPSDKFEYRLAYKIFFLVLMLVLLRFNFFQFQR